MTTLYGSRGQSYGELLAADTHPPGLLTSEHGFGREMRYAGREAMAAGFVPVEDYPDDLIRMADLKEIVYHCNQQQIFAKYHLERTGLDDWNQNGLPYCWAWGCAASVIACRALQARLYVRLAPVTLGRLVNWRSQGYYCDATLSGAKEYGIASVDFVPDSAKHSRNPSNFRAGWEEDALNYRPDEFWDTRKTSNVEMLCQMATILRTGAPLYVGLDWWRHALMIVGLDWDEREEWNVRVNYFNSHNDGFIDLTGWRAIPDVAFGVRSVHLAA